MLKSECLTGLDYCGEATVLTGSNKFAWFEFDWGTAVGAFDFLGYSHVV